MDSAVATPPASQDTEKSRTMGDILQKYMGQKTSILCTRYNYRGIVAEIGDSFVVLANACAVERSGPCSGLVPVTEDPIQGPVVISFGAIEIIFQPNWVHAPLPGDADYDRSRTQNAS